MSYLLELLGKGLQQPSLMSLVLPFSQPLSAEEVKLLNQSISSDPAHTANLLRLAVHYAQSGAQEQAEEILHKILQGQSHYIEAHLAWAALHASLGELDQAIEMLMQGYKTQKKDARLLFGLGYCHERKGDTGKALGFYQRACSCRPYLRKARQRLAAIYLVQQDYENVITQCLELQKQHPEDVWTYLALGQLYLHQQSYKLAIEQFERALTIEPDNFELRDDQVEALVKSDQIEAAIARLRQIMDEQGEFADTFVRLGDLYSQLGDDHQAVGVYERALEIHPEYLEAAVKLGTQHLRMGRYYEAAGKFNQGVEINDRLIGAYVGLGVAQLLNEPDKPEKARETFDLAAALMSNTRLLFAEMNRLQLKIAQTSPRDHKLYDLSSALPPDPQDQEDMIHIQMERYRSKLRQSPNHANIRYHYGLLLQTMGQPKEAIDHFQQALQINPSFFKAQIKLGLALREQNRLKKAEQQLREAFDLKHEYIDLHYKLSLMYCDKIKFALAVEHFETSLKGQGQQGDVQANLSLALQSMGLIDRAAAAWQAVCELEPQSTMAFQAQRSLTTLKQHML